MATLQGHLEQISVSANSIGDLHFPSPKIFTNAMLYNQEITTLIRDTEPHERALFSVEPNASYDGTSTSKRAGAESAARRKTINDLQKRQSSAVARVLGNDMLRKIQQSSRSSGRSRGVDIEVLLTGAERLSSVYSISGASERIAALRNRHSQIVASIEHYEGKVAKQQAKLNRAQQPSSYEGSSDPDDDEQATTAPTSSALITEDDLRVEEDAVKQLELRKKALEERVAGMEKDLGGLLG